MTEINKLAFITGITGQDGSYLSEFLISKNYKIYGIVRRTSLLYSSTRIEHLKDKINIHYGDITDSCALHSYLNKIIYDNPNFEVFEIYNLAAQSHVQISFEIPDYTTTVDALGPLYLLEFIKNQPDNIKSRIKFYQAGTSEMFGEVLETPQKETTPFNPRSPYACAKVYAHYLTKNYREAYNIFACNGILFNHGGIRRGHNFVERKITLGLGKIIRGETDRLVMGNLDSFRDIGNSKDYVEGMWMMLQHNKPDDYILATGKMNTIRNLIEIAFSYKDFNIKWKGEGINEIGYDEITGRQLIFVDKKFFRPTEVELLLGDSSKAYNILGWKSKTTIHDLLREMVIYDCK
jgi:GDPmannose 4,6-dehydratase